MVRRQGALESLPKGILAGGGLGTAKTPDPGASHFEKIGKSLLQDIDCANLDVYSCEYLRRSATTEGFEI